MPMRPYNDRRIAIIFLILITSAVYLPVINQQFSDWDDIKYISAVWKPGWQRAWRIVTDFDLQYTGEALLPTSPNFRFRWTPFGHQDFE